jgi:hypothetical protein
MSCSQQYRWFFLVPSQSKEEDISMIKCERMRFVKTVGTWLILNFTFQEILVVCCLVLSFSNKSVSYLPKSENFLINSNTAGIRHIYLYHISKTELSKMLTCFRNRHSTKKPTYIIYVYLFPTSLPFPIYILLSELTQCFLTQYTEVQERSMKTLYVYTGKWLWEKVEEDFLQLLHLILEANERKKKIINSLGLCCAKALETA